MLRLEKEKDLYNLSFHLMKLEKEQYTPKASRRREIVRIKAEISDWKQKEKNYGKSVAPKAGSLINKIDKSLVRLTKKKEDKDHQYQEKRWKITRSVLSKE